MMAKLSLEEAREIANGRISCRQAMANMGISRTHFYRIRNGEGWVDALKAMDGG